MHHRQNYLCDLLLLSVITIWGFNFAIIKLVYADFHPLAFNAARFVVASGVMVLLLRLRGGTLHMDRKDRSSVLRLALVSIVGYQFLFVLGLANTKAGNAALIMALTPILAYLTGIVQGRERFSRGVFLGIVLSLIGVAVIVFFGSAGLSFGGTWKGDLLMFGAAYCWAWYSASAQPLLLKYGVLRLTVMTMIVGAAILIPLSTPWLVSQDWQVVSMGAWLGMLYSTLLAIVFCAFGWAYALRKVGVARTAVFQNVTPIIALFGGWALLSERPTIAQVAGVLLALTGVFIVRRKKPPTVAVPDE
jgi:drug/metabolite transporter (DMT)-like permease